MINKYLLCLFLACQAANADIIEEAERSVNNNQANRLEMLRGLKRKLMNQIRNVDNAIKELKPKNNSETFESDDFDDTETKPRFKASIDDDFDDFDEDSDDIKPKKSKRPNKKNIDDDDDF